MADSQMSQGELILSEDADAPLPRGKKRALPHYTTNPKFLALFSPTRPLRIVSDVRENMALTLRLQGYTYDQIGEEMGFEGGNRRSAAWHAVQRALKELKEDTAEKASQVRDMCVQRLDALSTVYFPMAMQGDVQAAAIVLRIEKSRRDLLGLDAPTVVTDKNDNTMAIIKRVDVNMDEL